MFTYAKYIVVVDRAGEEHPFVFSQLESHADIARAMGGRIRSAGFCYVDNDKYTCYGESTSLGVKSRGVVDELLLNRMLGQS